MEEVLMSSMKNGIGMESFNVREKDWNYSCNLSGGNRLMTPKISYILTSVIWHLNVDSSHPGVEEGPKGSAIRRFNWYANIPIMLLQFYLNFLFKMRTMFKDCFCYGICEIYDTNLLYKEEDFCFDHSYVGYKYEEIKHDLKPFFVAFSSPTI
ncbi:hypothetical protein TorRG33x02_247460 [Trema orientale]|uniref:Uncharacterized protein n=1 Tax=Trema orientale TaxID=63057 RepID=A0A2P5DLJ5_TREOI|nr:hypothetical protein TorRG33x02_247460 [Trema orientale]